MTNNNATLMVNNHSETIPEYLLQDSDSQICMAEKDSNDPFSSNNLYRECAISSSRRLYDSHFFAFLLNMQFLNQKLALIAEENLIDGGVELNEDFALMEKQVVKINYTNPVYVLFWQPNPEVTIHPDAGVTLFTWRFYQHESCIPTSEVASATFYGQPYPCVSVDKTKHNLLKITGGLKGSQIIFVPCCHHNPRL